MRPTRPTGRLATITSVFRTAFANHDLRGTLLGYGAFIAMEFGVWIVFLVYGFDHGGATGGMTIALVQLVPAIALAPLLGALADRGHPGRFLFIGNGVQVASIAGAAVAVGTDAPLAVVYLLAAMTSVALTATRPTQSAILPSLVRTAEELTASRVMAGWSEGAASLLGPALAGLVMAWHGLGAALGVLATMGAVSMLFGARLLRVEFGVSTTTMVVEPEAQQAESQPGLSVWADIRASIRGTLFDRRIRVLLVLTTFFYVLVGAFDLLYVVLAIGLLHMGQSGAGYLNSAFGAGWLMAGFFTAFLVGRHPLARTLGLALLACVAALALIDAVPYVVPAIVLLAACGLAGAVFDTTAKTLLQRAAPPDALAGAFAVLESLQSLGLAIGAVLTWAGVRVAGVQGALLAPGIVAVVLLIVLWRRLRHVDDAATIPQVEIRLLRSISIFAALPAPAIEAVARELVQSSVAAGAIVIHEGDPGDRYYAVADGELEVVQRGTVLRRIGRGDGFGEIALIRRIPRTATVRATSDCLLYSLDGDLFVETVTGNPSATRVAGSVVDGHLGGRTDGTGAA